MAGEAGRSHWSPQTVVVLLLLCSLAPSLTCFSLRQLSKEAQGNKVAGEATVMEQKRESFDFNGSESGATSTAATGTSQLKDTEAAWRRLNPTLRCGPTKMTLKAMGLEAADLQLHMGNAKPLPLSQVPETCGYSMKQNALGLILVVPYDGCNVTQENGNYILPMSWQDSQVKLACPYWPSPDAGTALTTHKGSQHPWKLPFPHRPRGLSRHKRQATQPLYTYNPYLYYYYYYYYYLMNQALTTATPSTTAKPDTTTITTDTTTITTKPTTAKPPPVNPYYMYYPYFYYHPYYPYYPFPVQTTVPPATATGPDTSGTTTTVNMTTSAPTTKTPQKTVHPFYPPNYFYPYYHLPGQSPQNPDHPEMYYYPIIQHFYGKPPYPGQPSQTTTPPTTKPGDSSPTTKPGDSSPTTKPGDSSPTTKPGDSSPTSKPTTAPASTVTTKPGCSKKPGGSSTGSGGTGGSSSSSNDYPGPMSPFVSYHDKPFEQSISFKAGKLPDYQKFSPQDGYKSGLQARASLHPGFDHWQPAPWFPHETQDFPQFDWKNLQPSQV